MKKILSALVFAVCILSVNFCSAANLLANLSPAEFTAHYVLYLREAPKIIGSYSNFDFSKCTVQNVWRNPKEKDVYVQIINENYESGTNNAIYIYGGNHSADKGIYGILICMGNNFENFRDSLFVESKISLSILNITDANTDRIYRVIDGLDNEYRFFDSTAGKNILIRGNNSKNPDGHKQKVISIDAY